MALHLDRRDLDGQLVGVQAVLDPRDPRELVQQVLSGATYATELQPRVAEFPFRLAQLVLHRRSQHGHIRGNRPDVGRSTGKGFEQIEQIALANLARVAVRLPVDAPRQELYAVAVVPCVAPYTVPEVCFFPATSTQAAMNQ